MARDAVRPTQLVNLPAGIRFVMRRSRFTEEQILAILGRLVYKGRNSTLPDGTSS